MTLESESQQMWSLHARVSLTLTIDVPALFAMCPREVTRHSGSHDRQQDQLPHSRILRSYSQGARVSPSPTVPSSLEPRQPHNMVYDGALGLCEPASRLVANLAACNVDYSLSRIGCAKRQERATCQKDADG